MLNAHQLIDDFKKLLYDHQKQKVINFLQAIYDRTQQFGDTLELLQKVDKVPGQMLLEIYTSLIMYGDDMNNIKIKEKMWQTAYKLQLIREAEAKEKIIEDKELVAMEAAIMAIPN